MGPEPISGHDVMKYISNMIGVEMNFVEASSAHISAFLISQGYSEVPFFHYFLYFLKKNSLFNFIYLILYI